MEAHEAAEVLAVAAELDSRIEVTAPGARTWALALTHGGVRYAEAMAAVPMHYADPQRGHYRVTVADLVRIAGEIRAEDARLARIEAKRIERAELEAAGALPAGSSAGTPLRDRREDLRKLIESFRVDPDGHERWSLTGHPSVRRQQAGSVSPEVAAAAEAASRAKARAIVAASRAEGYASRPEPPELPPIPVPEDADA
jgi:hypothetical protein